MGGTAQFDFDRWAELARRDPAGFERARARLLRECIQRASPAHRRRLEGLQFQLDMERRRARTPLAACLRLSELMLDILHGEFLPRLRELAEGSLQAHECRIREGRPARVLPFRRPPGPSPGGGA